MTRRTLPLISLLFVIFAFFAQITMAEDAKTTTTQTPLAAADTLYRAGKLSEAGQQYEALLVNDPKLVHARVGLMRVRLLQQRVQDAYDLGKSGMAMPSYTTELLAEMGNVEFRRGEMIEAEAHYLKALRVDEREFHAHLGLAKLYDTYSMHRMAYDHLADAHKIAPQDMDVQRAWFGRLPRGERLKSIEEYLSSPHPDDEDYTSGLRHYAEYLRATVNKPVHTCQLASNIEKTQTPLITLMRDPTHVRGWGLQVKLNGHGYHLRLDTGASGIILGKNVAASAGLERFASMNYFGIGDQGTQSGYTAVAKHIRIGELEFEDCVVEVSDKAFMLDEDGFIGADVFASYLIDIDGPGLKLRLSPLPKRPEEAAAATALKTGGDSDEDETGEAKAVKNGEMRLPKDRWVAPEMKDWATVFQFGHHLLIPTNVNDSPNMLFMVDTGAFSNIISAQAARKVTKVSKEERMTVKGLSGAVNTVYSADKVKLQFSHFVQQNQYLVTLDLSNQSRHAGTEVSGFLGFEMLRTLEVKIDYRDGLVDFSYDPKRIPAFFH